MLKVFYYIELLFSFPLPYDVVLKYEVMREKALEKIGLTSSNAKIWKLQRDACHKLKLKSPKFDYEETERKSQDFLTRLETSHEITLKYGKYIEERLYSIHKIYSRAYSLIDSTPVSPLKFQSKLDELELIRYKDINRLKEMEITELRLLDQMSSRYINKEADLLVLIERIKDKLSYYDHAVRSLENQIDSIQLQHQSQRAETEGKMQEIITKYEIQTNDLEKYKDNSFNKSEMTERIREENKTLTLQNNHLKHSIEEFARNEKQNAEKYTKEIARLHDEMDSLKRIIKSKENELAMVEKYESSAMASKKLQEILENIREITHNVFIKYGTIQSEWQDSS